MKDLMWSPINFSMVLLEPRGHLALVAALQNEPDFNEDDAAFLFMTSEGYYSMSGLAIVSLGRYEALKVVFKHVSFNDQDQVTGQLVER